VERRAALHIDDAGFQQDIALHAEFLGEIQGGGPVDYFE
jgi:hypothetical protein